MSAETGVGLILLAVLLMLTVIGAWNRHQSQQEQARVYEQLQRDWQRVQRARRMTAIPEAEYDPTGSPEPIYARLVYETEARNIAESIAAFERGERP